METEIIDTIPHNKPTFSEDEVQVAGQTIHSGFVAQGPQVKAFEAEFCAYMGLPDGHAVAVSSGTAALYMALQSLGAKDKRVGLPVYTCSTLRHAVALCGATPVFCDTNTSDCNVDLDAIRASACDVAIVPHMYGFPQEIKNKAGINIIEDCAQSIGANVNGQKVGLQGDIGIFSFYATKLMTSGGQGGMIVSKDKALIDKIRDYRQFDCRKDAVDRFNFQMTDLQASIGRVQLKKLEGFLERRAQIFQRYVDAGLAMMYQDPKENIEPVRFRALMAVDHQDDVIQRLSDVGVSAITPIEDWELLDVEGDYPNSKKWCAQLLSLPCYPSLTDEQLSKIITTLTGERS